MTYYDRTQISQEIEYLSLNDKEIILKMLQVDNDYLRFLIVKELDEQRKLHPDVLAVLSDDNVPGIREIVARRTLELTLLEKLSHDPDDKVRVIVAQMCRLGVKTSAYRPAFEHLFRDPCVDVRKMMAETNPDDDLIAEDKDVEVRSIAASRTYVPEVQERFSRDPMCEVRLACIHDHTDMSIVERLTHDNNDMVRSRAIAHICEKNDTTFDEGVGDPSHRIRRVTATFTKDENILKKLSTDENATVRQVVAMRSQDKELLEKLKNEDKDIFVSSGALINLIDMACHS